MLAEAKAEKSEIPTITHPVDVSSPHSLSMQYTAHTNAITVSRLTQVSHQVHSIVLNTAEALQGHKLVNILF